MHALVVSNLEQAVALRLLHSVLDGVLRGSLVFSHGLSLNFNLYLTVHLIALRYRLPQRSHIGLRHSAPGAVAVDVALSRRARCAWELADVVCKRLRPAFVLVLSLVDP